MKSLPILVLVAAGLVGACSYRHETVERPAPAPAAAVVSTPAAPSGTVVYTDTRTPASSTTVYTR